MNYRVGVYAVERIVEADNEEEAVEKFYNMVEVGEVDYVKVYRKKRGKEKKKW
jgi:hypothetical protein